MAATTENLIIDHVKKNLSLSEDQISVFEINLPGLPPHLKFYYVEKEGTHGNVYFNYLVSGPDLFFSEDKDSFRKLLQKEKYFERRHLNVNQLIQLFSMLEVKFRDIEIIQKEDLAPDGSLYEYAEKIAPPSLRESPKGVEVEFWTTAINSKPRKWILTISPDYHVEHHTEGL